MKLYMTLSSCLPASCGHLGLQGSEERVCRSRQAGRASSPRRRIAPRTGGYVSINARYGRVPPSTGRLPVLANLPRQYISCATRRRWAGYMRSAWHLWTMTTSQWTKDTCFPWLLAISGSSVKGLMGDSQVDAVDYES